MKFIRNRYFIPVTIVLVLCILNARSFAGKTINVADYGDGTCALANVQAAYDAASSGDTIIVPSGTAEWNSYTEEGNIDACLHLRKGIYFFGAGSGSTVITITVPAYAFRYKPMPMDFASNHPLRISGFTFDLNNTAHGIVLDHSSSDLTIQTNIRIDHNTFLNGASGKRAIRNVGMRGVIDHNTFDTFVSSPLGFFNSYGYGDHWWDNWEGVVFGKKDNNMYVEDNVFQNLQGTVIFSQYEIVLCFVTTR